MASANRFAVIKAKQKTSCPSYLYSNKRLCVPQLYCALFSALLSGQPSVQQTGTDAGDVGGHKQFKIWSISKLHKTRNTVEKLFVCRLFTFP